MSKGLEERGGGKDGRSEGLRTVCSYMYCQREGLEFCVIYISEGSGYVGDGRTERRPHLDKEISV